MTADPDLDLEFVRTCRDSLDALILAMADLRNADDVEPPHQRLVAVKAALAALRAQRDEVVRLMGGGRLVRMGRIASRLGDDNPDWSLGWLRSLRDRAFERDADGAAWRDLTSRSHQLSTWLILLEGEPETRTPSSYDLPADRIAHLQAVAAIPMRFPPVPLEPILDAVASSSPVPERAEGEGVDSEGGDRQAVEGEADGVSGLTPRANADAAGPEAGKRLSGDEVEILRLLADKPGPHKAGAIADKVCVSERHLRRRAGSLADRGLVAATMGPTGGYSITVAGKRALAELDR